MHQGQKKDNKTDAGALYVRNKEQSKEDFVLEKNIFSNIFERDIRRVYIYKKAERLAKAIHLITPAFAEAVSLRARADAIAIALVDAAIKPPATARTALARELLALSSLLSIARTGSLLSGMNADLIAREAQTLLQEIAAYEEPRLFLEDAPTLAELAKSAGSPKQKAVSSEQTRSRENLKGHIKDKSQASVPSQSVNSGIKDRQDAILSVIRSRGGQVGIKEISTVIRNVSEKTIQRELQALIDEGVLLKEGERRWSTYSLRLSA